MSPSYLTDIQQTQAGKETTWGTGVVATSKIMGIKTFQIVPIADAIIQDDLRGSLAVGYNANLLRQGGEATFLQDASYEDILYFVESLLGVATPGGSGPYTRAYAAPLTAPVSSPRMQTMQYGQTGLVYALNGGLVDKLDLSGDDSNPMQAGGHMFGKTAGAGSLAALSDRSVNMMMGSQATIYVDAWGGTMGTTQLSATSWSWKLSLDSHRTARKFLNASLAPLDWNEGKWTGDLTLSVEANATSIAWLTTLLGAAGPLQLQVRIKYTLGANQIFSIDFAGTAPKVPALFSDRSGVVVFDLQLQQTYNTGLANWLKMASTNQVATIV